MDGLREELPGLGDQAGQDVQANGGVAEPAGRAQPGEAVDRFVEDLAAVVAGEGCGQLALPSASLTASSSTPAATSSRNQRAGQDYRDSLDGLGLGRAPRNTRFALRFGELSWPEPDRRAWRAAVSWSARSRLPQGGRFMRTIIVSAGVALILGLLSTPLAILVFSRRRYGQLTREAGPAPHATSRGTPIMGDTVLVVASLIGYVVGHVLTPDPMGVSGVRGAGAITGLGLGGFAGAFMQITRHHRPRI